MRNGDLDKRFFFVDESGDPVFYDRRGKCIVGEEGCSKILMLGLIRTEDPKTIRNSLRALRVEIAQDAYLQGIPSLPKSLKAFHAKDDCAEVREKVFKLIQTLDCKAEFVVARKKEAIFRKRHKGKETIFYDDLIVKLFENKLHRARKNTIYFAVRGNSTRQEPLEDAIQTALNIFEEKWSTKIDSEVHIYPQQPSDEPCLQVVDYMNWAVQRAYVKGDMRFYKFVEDKVSFLLDVYDSEKYPKNYYTKTNQFDVNKISPL